MNVDVWLALVVVAAAALVAVLWWRRRRPALTVERASHLGTQVLVAIGRPRSAAGLAGLGAALAQPEDGQVTTLGVVMVDADAATREGVERTLEQAQSAARQANVSATPLVRVDTTTADGLLHASVELDASLLVVGWPAVGQASALGAPVDRVVSDAPCPVLIARLDADRWSRVVLRIDEQSSAVDPHAHASLQLAVEVLWRIAQAKDVPAVSSAPIDVPTRRGISVPIAIVEEPDVGGAFGVADELTVVPVAPDAAAVADAVSRVRPVGDVILALSHGVAVDRRRALLSAAQELLTEAGTQRPDPSGQTTGKGGGVR